MFAKPNSQPMLRLDASLGSKKDLAKIRDNLSAIVLAGAHAWLGGDEGTHLHRLTRREGGDFGEHRRFDLAAVLDLPDTSAKPSEIDIEGLAVDDGYVWLVGSHSCKRKKAEPDKTPAENRTRLATIEADGNRYTLARVPLDGNAEPARKAGSRRAARLEGNEKENALTRTLASDPHIGPFCAIPSKDNGLDVEGLAVRGQRVFVGLRGPVLRGWAVLLDFEVRDSGAHTLEISQPVRKHFLQPGGLGVRDLVIEGDDLLILAGPTMDLDGPVFVFSWPGALRAATEVVLPRQELRQILEVPYGAGADHAEGMAFVEEAGNRSVMICYDTPASSRIFDDGVRVDVFDLA